MKQIENRTNGREALGPHKMRAAERIRVAQSKAVRRRQRELRDTYRAAVGLPVTK